MQDGPNPSTSIREIDEHGNALPHDPADAPEDTRKLRVNPFIVALWVLDAAIISLVSRAITESFETTFFGGTAPESGTVPVFFVLMNSVPQILLISSLTTVALLFWHAWQWQKRRLN